MTTVAITTIDKGNSSGVSMRLFQAVKDQAAWEFIWNQHQAGSYPKQAAPAVDFEKDMVLAAAVGQRSRGTYVVEIENVTETDEAIVATYSETSGGLSLGATVMSHPFHFVKVARSDKPVIFAPKFALGALDPADLI